MFQFSHCTDVGKRRSHNEDAYAFDEELGLYIVCDGMGGHQAGDIASKMTVETILKSLQSNGGLKKLLSQNTGPEQRREIAPLIIKAATLANKTVYETSLKLSEGEGDESSRKGMGTTLVMALKTPNGIFVAHVGDSRVYLIRGKKVIQLTEDHSFVNELLHAGQISETEARHHPQRNVITRAIGASEAVKVDVMFYEIMDGDSVILCSDGLHDYFSPKEFLIYRQQNKIDTLSKSLIQHALDGGGKDNITAIVMEWGQRESTRDQLSQFSVESKVEILKKIPLFKTLSYREISMLLELIDIVHYDKGATIVEQGQKGEDMFVILKGDAKVLVDGKPIAELGPGKYFGEMALIDQGERSATVVGESAMKVMRLMRPELFPLLKKEPRIGVKIFWSFLQTMNKRLRKNNKLFQTVLAEVEKESAHDSEVDEWGISELSSIKDLD